MIIYKYIKLCFAIFGTFIFQIQPVLYGSNLRYSPHDGGLSNGKPFKNIKFQIWIDQRVSTRNVLVGSMRAVIGGGREGFLIVVD